MLCSCLHVQVAPIIEFLRSQLGLKPVHMETHPHEAQVEEAAAAEVL
jgi:hypothetical protein